jgi:hypothetical protein
MTAQDELKKDGWNFSVEEISANVYQVTATDRQGRSVQITGTDPDLLLEDCRRDVLRMIGKTRSVGTKS